MEEPTTNAGRATFRESQAKAKRIIFDSVKDSIMPTMTSLMTAKESMDTLLNLYEKKAPNQKRTLKHKLKYLKMEKGESVASFCSRIAQIRDQLLVIGVTVDDDDLVQAIFDGLPSSWETFLSSVSGRERFNPRLRGYGMIASRTRVALLLGASQPKKSIQH